MYQTLKHHNAPRSLQGYQACDPEWKGGQCYLSCYSLVVMLHDKDIPNLDDQTPCNNTTLEDQGLDIKKHMAALTAISHDARRPATDQLTVYFARILLCSGYGMDAEVDRITDKMGRLANDALAVLEPGRRTLCFSSAGLFYRSTAESMEGMRIFAASRVAQRQQERAQRQAGPIFTSRGATAPAPATQVSTAGTARAAHPADACHTCGKLRCHVKISVCVRCGEVGYCSTECQRKDWRRHKHAECRLRNDVRPDDIVEVSGMQPLTSEELGLSQNPNGELFTVVRKATPKDLAEQPADRLQPPAEGTLGCFWVLESASQMHRCLTAALLGRDAKAYIVVHSAHLERTHKEVDMHQYTAVFGAEGETVQVTSAIPQA